MTNNKNEKLSAVCTAVYDASQAEIQLNGGTAGRAVKSKRLEEQITVGDRITVEIPEYPVDGCGYMITELLPRKNSVKRLKNGAFSDRRRTQLLAANVDVIFIVTSANSDFNISRLDRYYVMATESGARIYFVLSKCDLTQKAEEYADLLRDKYKDCDVLTTSIYESVPEDDFKLYRVWKKDETAVFLGSSGVGKSSLINYMQHNSEIKTGAVREYDGKGRHTTSVRHMYSLSNGRIIIDTPGLRSIGLESDNAALDDIYSDIAELSKQCRYSDCRHDSEPGCALNAAIEDRTLEAEKYLRYLKIKGKNHIYKKILSKCAELGILTTDLKELKRRLKNETTRHKQ